MMDSSICSIGEEGKGNAIGDVHADHMCPGRAITSGNDELLSPKEHNHEGNHGLFYCYYNHG